MTNPRTDTTMIDERFDDLEPEEGEEGGSDELFEHPLHPYTRSLLSAIPLPDPHSEKNRQRIVYNSLAEHDYSINKPSLREIKPGHFVYCNDEEEMKYKKELGL